MSVLRNIDLNAYSLFAYTEQKQPLKLEVRVDSGYVEFTGCDLFEIDSGTIICFKNKTFDGFHDLKITGNKTDYIQIIIEKDSLDFVLNEIYKPGYNFYAFLDSQVQESTKIFEDLYNIDALNLPRGFVKCDYKKFGGTAFYEPKVGYNVVSGNYILNISGIGHIFRIGTSNEGNLNQGSQAEYTAARTLTALMKLIYEWSIVSKEPFNNNEKISQSASKFLEELNLGDEIMSDIVSSTGDMTLARYLKGDTERSNEIESRGKYDIPESFANYIKKHYSYPSLYHLDKVLNLNIFDEELIQNYINYFETLILNFFYTQGIDISQYENLDQIYELDITPNYVKEYIKEYKEIRNIEL